MFTSANTETQSGEIRANKPLLFEVSVIFFLTLLTEGESVTHPQTLLMLLTVISSMSLPQWGGYI